jgi:hypothetical protein
METYFINHYYIWSWNNQFDWLGVGRSYFFMYLLADGADRLGSSLVAKVVGTGWRGGIIAVKE